MNWDAVGAVGQVLGSIAVFVTLGYLAVQVKHASSESRRALSQGRGEALRDLWDQSADERMSRLMVKANGTFNRQIAAWVTELMDQAGLTHEDVFSLMGFQAAWWDYRVQMITHITELPAEERTVFDIGIRGQYGTPGFSCFYYNEIMKPLAHPNTVAYIDSVLAQPG